MQGVAGKVQEQAVGFWLRLANSPDADIPPACWNGICELPDKRGSFDLDHVTADVEVHFRLGCCGVGCVWSSERIVNVAECCRLSSAWIAAHLAQKLRIVVSSSSSHTPELARLCKRAAQRRKVH